MSEHTKATENWRKHYDWVKKQINVMYPPGGSPNEIIDIAITRRKEQKDLPFEWEKDTPGKGRIRKIIEEGNGIDWDYTRAKGGAKNKSKLIPKSPDSAIKVEKSLHVLRYSEISSRLQYLYSKKNSKFSVDDYFEFVKIKNQLFSFPMSVYYAKIERGLNRDNLFKSIVLEIKKDIERLKKIEKDQLKINKKASEIILLVTQISNLKIEKSLFLPSVKDRKLAILLDDNFELGELLPLTKALKRLMIST